MKKRPIVAISKKGNTDIKDIVDLFEKIDIDSNNGSGNIKNSSNIDSLICKINEIKVHDSDAEWETILNNYENLLKFKNMKTISQKPFELFMEKIDSMNQYYLKNLDLTQETYSNEYHINDVLSVQEMVKEIETSLVESLNIKDSTKKLDYVLTAYKHMIRIVCEFTHKKVKRSELF
jgi:predicted DNA-binding protein YlxM (UPF0122 family)